MIERRSRRGGILGAGGVSVLLLLAVMVLPAVGQPPRLIEFELEDMPKEDARRKLEAMAKQLLANTVIEDFQVEVL